LPAKATSTRARKVIAIVAVTFGLVAVYLGIRLTILAVNLNSAYGAASVALSSSSSGSPEQLKKTIASMSANTSWAANSAQDPLVVALDVVPFVGADVHAIRTAAISINQLVMSGEPVFELATVVQSRIHDKKSPLGDKQLVLGLRDGINELTRAANQAVAEFKTVNVDALHFGLGPKMSQLKDVFARVDSGLTTLKPSANVVTTLFAVQEKQTWFVATQNLAELRATGGLLGSYDVIQVENGSVKLLTAGADKVLLARGAVDYSVYPESIRDLWGADLADWRDFGVSAHVPYTAELIQSAYEQKFGTRVDGVLFLGQGELAKLLGATGGLKIWGQTVDATNAVSFLTKTIYAKYPDVDQKNAFVSALMTQLLPKLSSPSLSLSGLLTASANDKTGDQPAMWSADAEQEKIIQRLGIGGEVSSAPGSNVTVSVNNAGGNKLDAYFTLSASYVQSKCGVATIEGLKGRESRVTITVKNGAPPKGLPAYVNPRLDLIYGQSYIRGSNRELVTVYAPVGSSDNGMKLDGQVADFVYGADREHPVYVFEVLLNPGQTRTLEVNFIEPTIDAQGVAVSTKPSLRVTPMISRPSTSITTAGACPVAG
jgi:hypothetical protein